MRLFATLRSSLSQREFALWWAGQSISQFGDGVLNVALPLLVLDITKNATDMGLVVAARLVPTVLFLLLGGLVSDRVSRRLAALTSDAVRAVASAVMGVLAVAGHLNLPELLVGSFVFGLFDALFYPASTALLPEIIAAGDLTAANSLSRLAGTLLGGLLGPVVGGVIASTIGSPWALVVDAASFVISAVSLAAMRPTPTPEASPHSMLADIAAGWSYCRRTPWIIWTIVVAGFANAFVFTPSAILLPLFLRRVLHSPNWMVGVAFAALGVGGLAGSLLMMGAHPRRRVRVMWLVWTIATLLAIPYAVLRAAWIAVVLSVVAGALLMLGNILWQSLMQAEVPSEILGRVSSVDWAVSLGLSPVGVALAGAAADHFGVRTTIVVPGLVVGVVGLTLLFAMPSITAIDRRESDAGESGAVETA